MLTIPKSPVVVPSKKAIKKVYREAWGLYPEQLLQHGHRLNPTRESFIVQTLLNPLKIGCSIPLKPAEGNRGISPHYPLPPPGCTPGPGLGSSSGYTNSK